MLLPQFQCFHKTSQTSRSKATMHHPLATQATEPVCKAVAPTHSLLSFQASCQCLVCTVAVSSVRFWQTHLPNRKLLLFLPSFPFPPRVPLLLVPLNAACVPLAVYTHSGQQALPSAVLLIDALPTGQQFAAAKRLQPVAPQTEPVCTPLPFAMPMLAPSATSASVAAALMICKIVICPCRCLFLRATGTTTCVTDCSSHYSVSQAESLVAKHSTTHSIA